MQQRVTQPFWGVAVEAAAIPVAQHFLWGATVKAAAAPAGERGVVEMAGAAAAMAETVMVAATAKAGAPGNVVVVMVVVIAASLPCHPRRHQHAALSLHQARLRAVPAHVPLTKSCSPSQTRPNRSRELEVPAAGEARVWLSKRQAQAEVSPS